MRRFHQELALMERQRRIASTIHKLDRSGARYRKRKALDCGHTWCAGCHHDKVFDITTPRMQRANDSFRQQLLELE